MSNVSAVPAPLRFGILCNGTVLAAWQAAAIRQLMQNGNAHPALVIVNGRPQRRRSWLARLGRLLNGRNQLWKLHNILSRPPARQLEDMSAELHGVPALTCVPLPGGRFAHRFSSQDAETIRDYDLDFILRFGFGILQGEILNAARYGVWSFHHGDESKYRGGPPGFWEIAYGDAVTGVIFQRLTERLDAGIVLRRGHFKTVDYSYARNLQQILTQAADWPDIVARTVRFGALDVGSLPQSDSVAKIYKAPTNLEMIRYAFVLAKNIARRIAGRLKIDEWNVGILKLTPAQAIAGTALDDVDWHPGLSGGWLADPMAQVVEDKIEVLCERMDPATNRGRIESLSYNGGWSTGGEALETSCHASFPYLFWHESQLYCVPETHAAKEVRLYVSDDFPARWSLKKTLLRSVDFTDSVIFSLENRWWLLATNADIVCPRLHAYYAESPLGPWMPHELNPIKIDVRSSRAAGPPFWVDGALYRPSQDCSRVYGGRIAVNRIILLAPDRFEERTVAFLEPDRTSRYSFGLHTLSFAGEYAVIDGRRWRARFSRT